MANKFIDEPGFITAMAGLFAISGGGLGLLYALYSIIAGQTDSYLGELAFFTLFGAFYGCLAGLLLAVSLFILSSTFNAVRYTKNPFIGILKLLFYPVAGFAFFDQIFFGGDYIVWPLISLLIEGTIEGTIYSCQDWIIHDEGSYCNDS